MLTFETTVVATVRITITLNKRRSIYVSGPQLPTCRLVEANAFVYQKPTSGVLEQHSYRMPTINQSRGVARKTLRKVLPCFLFSF